MVRTGYAGGTGRSQRLEKRVAFQIPSPEITTESTNLELQFGIAGATCKC